MEETDVQRDGQKRRPSDHAKHYLIEDSEEGPTKRQASPSGTP